jgi:hypothetical protein
MKVNSKTVAAKVNAAKPSFTLPKGCEWFVSIGAKGVALFPASFDKSGNVLSRHDGGEFPAVEVGGNGSVGILPWSKQDARWLGVKAYVHHNGEAGLRILPLAAALKTGAVREVKLVKATRSGATVVVVPKGFDPAQKLPAYIGERSTRGHIEPRKIVEVRADRSGTRNERHLDAALAFAK